MEVQLHALLECQDEMNKRVDPDWRIHEHEYYRAAWIECAELMDHYGYKWWKKQTPDMDQVKLEIVDILHFVLSIYLKWTSNHTSVVKQLIYEFEEFKPNELGVLLNAELMARALLTPQYPFIFKTFLNLMTSAGMTFDDTLRLYFSKNVLNLFRQNNGYKTGTYIKIWNGREDNEHLAEIILSLDSESPSFKTDLYDKLQDRYLEFLRLKS